MDCKDHDARITHQINAFGFGEGQLILISNGRSMHVRVDQVDLRFFARASIKVFRSIRSSRDEVDVLRVTIAVRFSKLRVVVVASCLQARRRLVLVRGVRSAQTGEVRAFRALKDRLYGIRVRRGVSITGVVLAVL